MLSVTGRYSNQRSVPFPPVWLLTKLLAQHGAGLVFAAAVLPFVGTLVAAYLYLGSRRSRPVTAFAAMSVSVTVFLTGLAGYASYGQSYAPGATDLKRIHERYFMYVLPLFIIAMLATTAIPRSNRMRRLGLAATGIAAVVVLVIPYGTIINNGVAPDTFGLAPLAHSALRGGVDAWPHATLLAIAYVLCLGVIYALARPNIALLVAVTAVIFVIVTLFEVRLLDAGATTRDGPDAAGEPGLGRRRGAGRAGGGAPDPAAQPHARPCGRRDRVLQPLDLAALLRVRAAPRTGLRRDPGDGRRPRQGADRRRRARACAVRRGACAPRRRGSGRRREPPGASRAAPAAGRRAAGQLGGGAGVGVPAAEAVSRSTITCSSRKSTAVPGSAR